MIVLADDGIIGKCELTLMDPEAASLKYLYLIRHCKAEGQESEAKLTNEGYEQSLLLAEFLNKRKIDYILSSPYERAVSTIKPLAKKLHLSINTDERLKERVLSSEHLNDWMDKLSATYADFDLRFPGGETSKEAMNRGLAVIRELGERTESNFAIVTHGNLMSLMISHFDPTFGFEEWKNLSNPDVYELKLKSLSLNQYSLTRIWEN